MRVQVKRTDKHGKQTKHVEPAAAPTISRTFLTKDTLIRLVTLPMYKKCRHPAAVAVSAVGQPSAPIGTNRSHHSSCCCCCQQRTLNTKNKQQQMTATSAAAASTAATTYLSMKYLPRYLAPASLLLTTTY